MIPILMIMLYQEFSHLHGNCQSTSGKEFVLGFMANERYKNNEPLNKDVLLISTATTDIEANVTFMDDLRGQVTNMSVVIPAESVYKITLPPSITMEGTTLSRKVIRVLADVAISVIAINMEYPSTDGYLAFPLTSLGTRHYAVTFGNCSRGCQFAVISGSQPTVVQIIFPDAFSLDNHVFFDGTSIDLGRSMAISLKSYEAFQLQSRQDFTGTFVRSDNPVAFFSGHKKTSYPGVCCAEHLVEQIPPVDAWGKQFLTPVTPGRKEVLEDVYRVIASRPNTSVRVHQNSLHLESAGSWKEFTLDSNDLFWVEADKPVLLMKFIIGDNKKSKTDPCMTIVVPRGQWIQESVFTLHERFDVNYVVITGTADLEDSLMLNGNRLPNSTMWSSHDESGLVGASLLLENYTYVLRTKTDDTRFAAYLISGRMIESYCLPVGMDLSPINMQTNMSTSCEGLYNETQWAEIQARQGSTIPMTTEKTPEPQNLTRASTEKSRTTMVLLLNRKNTSRFRRKLNSQPTNDVISEIIGWMAVWIMCAIFFVCLCVDSRALIRAILWGTHQTTVSRKRKP